MTAGTKHRQRRGVVCARSERHQPDRRPAIKDVMPLPPPEHLIRFFPIAGTPVETLIGDTRSAIRQHHATARTTGCWSIIGPCSIHDPVAALEYARTAEGRARALRRHARRS